MAYAILLKDESVNDLYRIAEDDAEKNSLNINVDDYRIIEISSADFSGVQLGTKKVDSTTTDSITFTDITPTGWPDADLLKSRLRDNMKSIEQFLKNNSSNAMYSFWNTYKSTLENFDYSGVTFPMTQTWEQYCADNSIAFKNMLQLP